MQLDGGLEVADARFIGKLAQCLRPGGSFFLRYKGGAGGPTSGPSRTWQYRPEEATLVLEQHTFDRVEGVQYDEWVHLNLARREVTMEYYRTKLVSFSQFREMMEAAGFTLAGAWAGVDGSPVTENSRIYAWFRK